MTASIALTPSISPASLVAGSNLTPQQLTLTTTGKAMLGASTFPPQGLTLAGATVPPLAAFGASFLNAVLPTNQTSQVLSPFSPTPAGNPGQPTNAGENTFAASYAPEVYAVYLNGLVANAGVNSAALETNTYNTDVAQPPISGDPGSAVPGAPPVQPVPAAEGTQQVIAAISQLAGNGAIFSSSSGSAPKAAASTGAHQSSASSHSTSHVATK